MKQISALSVLTHATIVGRKAFVMTCRRHYTLCEKYPSSCPTGCLAEVHRNTLLSHLVVCLKWLAKCKFRQFEYECPAVLEVKTMEKHLVEEKDHHLKMAIVTVVKLSVCMGQLLSAANALSRCQLVHYYLTSIPG